MITSEDVDAIAKLSRLSFTEQEKEIFLEEFRGIVAHVSKVNAVDTTSVEPCSNVFSLCNVMRKDEVCPSMDRDELLANAPEKEDGAYLVPRTVEA